MTITLTLWQAAVIVLGATLTGFAVGAACILGLIMRDAPLPPLRVERPTEPIGPLAEFPGWDVVTAAELDQFARHYQGITR